MYMYMYINMFFSLLLCPLYPLTIMYMREIIVPELMYMYMCDIVYTVHFVSGTLCLTWSNTHCIALRNVQYRQLAPTYYVHY